MKITDLNEWYFGIEPDNPTDKNKLSKFPGFQRVRGKFLMPKKPAVVQNLIHRFKKGYKDPIPADPSFREYMTSTEDLLEIPVDFPWVNTPYRHQELALRFLYTHGSAGLLLEPGLGKTFIVLNYIKLMGFKKSLIVCPKALLFVWEDEVREHRPDLTIHVMSSTSWEDKKINASARADKWSRKVSESSEGTGEYERAMSNLKTAQREIRRLPELQEVDLRAAEAADIVVVNYEKVTPGLKLLESMKFEMIAVDEGLIKSMKTNRTKAIHKLGSKIPIRIIMSGTLVNNGPLDIYSPVKFIEPSLVGGGYGAFEYYYARIAKAKGGRRFVAGVGKRQTEEIRDILASCSIVMTKDEWLDLPEKNFHKITTPMSDQQKVMYEELRANHICSVDDGYLEVDNPLTVACYLNQIANGFVYTYDGEDEEEDEDDFASLFDDYEVKEKGDRKTTFLDSGKKDALRNLIVEELDNKKFILWYNMQAEYEQIIEILDDLEVEWISVKGGEKDVGGKVRSFNNSGTCRVLVSQSMVINYGVTVLGRNPEDLDKEGVTVMPDFDTNVYTQVFWSLSWSLERFTQMTDRCHRIGQKRDCDYYILLCEDTIDELVWDRLGRKKTISQTILVDYIKGISM